MSGIFYKSYWDIVGDDLCLLVQDFFRSGRFIRKLNQTFIVLISKKEGASNFNQFRPISLCNVSYKVISKILANRIRQVLDKLISPFQSAFISGRWIAENSVLAQEIMTTLKRKIGKGGLMGLKLDMSKAYDHIEWTFLHKVLLSNGFNDKFCKLIMFCLSSVFFSILLNGSPLKSFKSECGLRQGDPLSPYLFNLCSEVLTKLLLREENRGTLHGIKISRQAPAISHLMFADDTMIFCRANTREATSILNCLDTYEKWSGQSFNRGKSKVFFSKNTCRSIKAATAQMLRM